MALPVAMQTRILRTGKKEHLLCKKRITRKATDQKLYYIILYQHFIIGARIDCIFFIIKGDKTIRRKGQKSTVIIVLEGSIRTKIKIMQD